MPILPVIYKWDISGINNFHLAKNVQKVAFCRFFNFLQYLILHFLISKTIYLKIKKLHFIAILPKSTKY